MANLSVATPNLDGTRVLISSVPFLSFSCIPPSSDGLSMNLIEGRTSFVDLSADRPAHTGPIAGLFFSPADEGRDCPAFAATVGEENKIEVRDVLPVLDLETGSMYNRYPVGT